MSGLVASRLISEFLFAFGALFAIINPVGLAFVFLDKTKSLSERERASVAFRVALYCFAVLLVSLFIGSQILNFFGISIPALRIAGGLVVAASGWAMPHAPPPAHDTHATSTGNFEAVRQMAFFPLTIPLTTGPGTIATAIAIGANRPNDLDELFSTTVAWFAVSFVVTVAIYLAYKRSGTMPAWSARKSPASSPEGVVEVARSVLEVASPS